MAMNTAANLAEKVLGRGDAAVTTDLSNPANKGEPAGSGTMLALIWNGKNSVKVVKVPEPTIVDPDDVTIKVTGSTVCGSDLHLYHGSILEMKKNDILGHEFCGIVDKIGPNVKHVKPGDRVVASFQIACGKCQYCKKGYSSMCDFTNNSAVENQLYGKRTAGMFGYAHLTGGFAGGQAEMVRVPFGDVNLLQIPDDVPDEKALYLSDVLTTSYHCVVDTGVKDGDVVGVWGAGPIGYFVARWAYIKGAKRVIMVDSNWRLDWIKKRLPNVETLDFSKVGAKEGVSGAIKKMVPDGLDVALECASGEFTKGYLAAIETAVGLQTDTSEIINEMILAVRKFGRIGITGIYAGFTNHFNIGAIMETGIRLIGNGQAPVQLYWKDVLKDYVQTGKIDPLEMVTHRVDIADLEQVYKAFDNKDDGMMKVYVQTKYSASPCEGCPPLVRM